MNFGQHSVSGIFSVLIPISSNFLKRKDKLNVKELYICRYNRRLLIYIESISQRAKLLVENKHCQEPKIER